jgi:hypothetical protein
VDPAVRCPGPGLALEDVDICLSVCMYKGPQNE